MFGLFGKKSFDSEMAELEKRHKSLGADLVGAMQRMDVVDQMRVMGAMLSLYDKRIECCKRYGRLDTMSKLESERAQLQQLHG